MKEQQKAHWLAEEVGDFTRDLSTLLDKGTEADKHAIKFTSALFVAMEGEIGNVWVDRIYKEFPHLEIQGMCVHNASMELGPHIESYDKILPALGIDQESTYLKFFEMPELSKRREHFDKTLNGEDIVKSLVMLSLLEGVSLFAQFAFFRSFSEIGMLKQLDNLIEWSARDEGSIHLRSSIGLILELEKEGEYVDGPWVKDICLEFLEQEKIIIDEMFRIGESSNITKSKLLGFVKHRINLVTELLGFHPLFTEYDREVESWFYKDHNLKVDRDFFDSRVTEYQKGYDFSDVWDRSSVSFDGVWDSE